MIVRLAQEKHAWGHGRIHGELFKLDYSVGRSTVCDVLKRWCVPPVPPACPTRQPRQILACNFFTVETLCLLTGYGLFFTELGTRRIHLAGCTAHPTAAWVTQ